MNENFKAGEKLGRINVPKDLREQFSIEDLSQVSDELRQFIIDVVSEIGNSHFGASIGVVELTVALHYAFNTPKDQIIWDVGHQAYGHKILTGRRSVFHTNRKKGGLSGFPSRNESEFDTFGTGHSSTSISAAIGMSVANEYQRKKDTQHIAVIGDGALTGGMAFEGLNHAGSIDTDLIVVLNDNCMSIDPNVGALKTYLSKISTTDPNENTKEKIWELLSEVSKFGSNKNSIANSVAKNLEISALKQSHLFESLNFQYYGPFDGHDAVGLAKTFLDIKKVKGPKIVHVLTKKGGGYKFSEEGNPTTWHAPGVFNKSTGEIIKTTSSKPTLKYQEVFGQTIVELAKLNKNIMGITPAMPTGSSLDIMMKEMPDRAFDVGIAEQHAVTFSAGLATKGMIPFCNIYSTFMQRAYDQVIHDVALQNLPVVFCLDRAGLVGPDGATHHGAFDIPFMRTIPNMIVCAPMNGEELRNMMFSAQQHTKSPISIRYPRGKSELITCNTEMSNIQSGTGRELSQGTKLAVLTIGHIGNRVQKLIHNNTHLQGSVAHFDMRFVKPLDGNLLNSIFNQFQEVITIEDGALMGGFGSAIIEYMMDHQFKSNIQRIGLPDKFIEHGSLNELHADCGLDSASILKKIEQVIS